MPSVWSVHDIKKDQQGGSTEAPDRGVFAYHPLYIFIIQMCMLLFLLINDTYIYMICKHVLTCIDLFNVEVDH